VDPSSDFSPPKDGAEEAVIGVAEFRMRGSSSRDLFLGRNIGRLFLEHVGEVSTHAIGPNEREFYAAGLIRKARLEELKTIDSTYEKRDSLLFSGLRRPESGTYAAFSGIIERAKKNIARYDSLDPAEVEIIEEKKLLLAKTQRDENLLSPVFGAPRDAARAAKVDYLLWGDVEEELPGYFYVSVYLYGATADRVLYSDSSLGRFNELDSLVDEMFLNLATALVGRDWAGLEISLEQKDAGIFLDGDLVGIGEAKLSYIKPGPYRLLIGAGGYETREEDIVLESRSVLKKVYTLTPLDRGLFVISSEPPGAGFYAGALRLGSTPYTLGVRGTHQIGRLELDGYKSAVFPLPAEGADSAFYILPRDLVSWDERIEKKRADFYSAFGWFVLSLPIPIVLYGLYENSSYGYLQYTKTSGYDRDEAKGMAERLDILYYSYFGSLFLSGSFLFNAVMKLFDYIAVGEEAMRYPEKKSNKD
jgi:hypothetical protein